MRFNSSASSAMKATVAPWLVALALTVVATPAAVEAQGRGTGTPPGSTGLPDPSKMPSTLKVPETFEGLFAERDGRADEAIGYFRCMQSTVNALRSGALGMVPREWSITCVREGREWRGVFGTLRDGTIDVTLQYAVREKGSAITSAPVDTARVNGTARALLRGLAAPLPGAGRFEFTPVPLPQKTFVEVWFLPIPSNPARVVIGGDSLIQMTTDGVRELGHGRTTPAIRTVSVPRTGSSFSIQSSERQIPTVSELMVARMALDVVPEVRIQTYEYESVLTRTRRWTHRKR